MGVFAEVGNGARSLCGLDRVERLDIATGPVDGEVREVVLAVALAAPLAAE
jgi:hypothetical protein